MRKINYSEFDLSGFSVKELQRICRYYGIQYGEDWNREKLIAEVLAFSPNEIPAEKNISYPISDTVYQMMYPATVIEPEVPTKSVRLQRIEESMKKEM